MVDFNEVLTGLPGLSTRRSAGSLLELHTTGSSKDADPQGSRSGKGTGNLLLDWTESYPSVFEKIQNTEWFWSPRWGDSEVLMPARMWPRMDGAHPPGFRLCRHPLNSHCWTQRKTQEVRKNLAKGFNLENIRVTAAPVIRYYSLMAVITMFLNNWLRERQTASLASNRAAHDPWEQMTCGCRKKSPQTQDLRSTSLLQIRATWLKQSAE